MLKETLLQYDAQVQRCKTLFCQKNADYGSAWRILRLPSLTDQIKIKAQRIRNIQESEMGQSVDDGIDVELQGIFNYSVVALMQMYWQEDARMALTQDEVERSYEKAVGAMRSLLETKNHDYREAWRAMRLSSMVDIILMKLLRLKHLEDSPGEPLVSEGAASNYQDIGNYAALSLIRISENHVA